VVSLVQAPMLPKKQKCVEARGLAHVKKPKKFTNKMEKSKMKTKMILILVLAILIVVADTAKAQDGSEYLLWEKTKDFTIMDIAFSPDETQIAVAAEYQSSEMYYIKILSALTGEELYSIKVPHLAWPLTYSPNGKYLVEEGNGNEVLFYETKTYTLVKEIPSGIISFTADSKLFSKTASGYKFRLYNSETFETVFEQSLVQPESDETGSLDVFFTPNGKYIIANSIFIRKSPYSGTRIVQEIFDAKTYQKIDKTINCLKNPGSFSNNGLVANTFPKEGSSSTQSIGFRIYDYDKDSLIWEQKTAYIGSMNFIKNTDYLLTLFQPYINDSEYEKTGNCRIWDLKQNKLKNKFPVLASTGLKISINSRFLLTLGNGLSTSTLRMYDFSRIFIDHVSVNGPEKSKEINITANSDSNLIKINQISNEITNIAIYDLSGNLVDTIFKGNSLTDTIEYNTSHLAKGAYLIRIDTEQDSITKKIIIE